MRPSLFGVSDSLCLTSHIPLRLCLPSSLCRDPGSWSFGLMPPSPPYVPGNHHRRLFLPLPHSFCFLADQPGPGPAELPCMRLLHVPASSCTAKPLPCGPSVCAAERHVTPFCVFFFFLRLRDLPILADSTTNEPVANMLRRLVSLGHSASDDKRPMSPSPGDEQHPQEAKGAGGLAGVFKGLTGGGKPAKSPPVLQQPFAPIAASQAFAERSDVTPPPSALPGLSPEQVELFGRLKNSQQLSERVAAANSLRYAIADFPLNPVRTWCPFLSVLPLGPVSDVRIRRVGSRYLAGCERPDRPDETAQRSTSRLGAPRRVHKIPILHRARAARVLPDPDRPCSSRGLLSPASCPRGPYKRGPQHLGLLLRDLPPPDSMATRGIPGCEDRSETGLSRGDQEPQGKHPLVGRGQDPLPPVRAAQGRYQVQLQICHGRRGRELDGHTSQSMHEHERRG